MNNLPDTPRRSNIAEILHESRGILMTSVSAALLFGAASIFGAAGGGGGGPVQPLPPQTPFVYDPPAQPSVTVLVPLDTSSVRVTVSMFNGDQDDTQDSLQIQLDSVTNFTTAINAVTQGVGVNIDTLTDNSFLTEDNTYYVRARYFGFKSSLWSEWSTTANYDNTTTPGTITDLSVVGVTDSSATVEWTSTHNGQGGVSVSNIRWDTDPPIFFWEHSDLVADTGIAFANADSITGDSIGAVTQYTIQGLSAGQNFEVQALAYRGILNGPSEAVSAASNIASGTTTSGVGGTDPPNTPTLGLVATSDTSQIQMNGSGFSGDGTHSKSQWQLDNNSDLSSPFYNDSSSAGTSHLVTDNANLTGGATYYGRVRYQNEYGWSGWSTIQSVENTIPTPGSCSWCTPGAEPSNMITVTDNNFSNFSHPGWGTPFATTGGTSVWCANDVFLCNEIIEDNTSPRGGDNMVLRSLTPEGLQGGGEVLVYHINPFPATDTVFVAFYMKFSSNWVMQPAGQKLGFVNEQPYAGVPHIISAGAAGGQDENGRGLPPFFYYFRNQGPSPPGGSGWPNINTQNRLPNIGNSGTAVNTWKLVEWLYVQNSADSLADGEWHMWVGGNKVAEYFDVYYGQLNQDFTNVYINFNWGGIGNVVPADQYIYIDSWYVSRR